MKHFGESLLYTIINVVGSFITLIFAFGVSLIEENTLSAKEIFGKGEVIIICVPLCISVIYSLYHNKKTIGSFNISSILFWLTLFLVMFCTWLYSKFINKEDVTYTDNLYIFSLIIFFWTAIVMLISKWIDTPISNVQQDRKKNLDELEEKVNRLNN